MPRLVGLAARIDELNAQLGMSEAQFAEALHVQPRTVDRWRAETAFPQHESRHRLEALMALADRLVETFKTSADAAQWLHSESAYFGGLRPVDALLRGRFDLIDAALEAMDSGISV